MLLSKLTAGGAEISAARLVRALTARGYEFVVASVTPGGELADRFRRAGATVQDGLARSRLDLPAAARVAGLCRRHRIDALVVVDVPRSGMLFGSIGAVLSGRRMPRICWCKSIPGGQSGWFMRPLRACRATGLIGTIVCTSRLQRRALVAGGIGRRHMPLIRNGIELPNGSLRAPADLPHRPGKRLLVQVANVMPDKDHATLLAAAGRLARRRDDFHLLLVGRGTDSTAMARVIERAGADGAVTSLGLRGDVPAIISAADVFVLSTHSEVFSVATLEALAAGVPVVVSDIPAFDEMFTHGREGLKVPPGDPVALADALGSLLDDAAGRRRMADAARQRAERFGLARMTDSFDRLLRTLIRR